MVSCLHEWSRRTLNWGKRNHCGHVLLVLYGYISSTLIESSYGLRDRPAYPPAFLLHCDLVMWLLCDEADYWIGGLGCHVSAIMTLSQSLVRTRAHRIDTLVARFRRRSSAQYLYGLDFTFSPRSIPMPTPASILLSSWTSFSKLSCYLAWNLFWNHPNISWCSSYEQS